MTNQNNNLRPYFREPISEINDAARYLDAAVSAHLAGNTKLANELILMADMPEIREWSDSLISEDRPYVHKVEIADPPPELYDDYYLQLICRGISDQFRATIIMRDGYHCKFCGMCLIHPWVIDAMNEAYSESISWWADENVKKHAAFQVMEMQMNFIVPFSRGGDMELNNCVAACSPCHYGRGENLLEEVGLRDPRTKEPLSDNSWWRGLTRFPRMEKVNFNTENKQVQHQNYEEACRLVAERLQELCISKHPEIYKDLPFTFWREKVARIPNIFGDLSRIRNKER